MLYGDAEAPRAALLPVLHATRVMGTLRTAGALAAFACLTRRHQLARPVLLAGLVQRAAEVGLKRAVGRRRPAALLPGVRPRIPASTAADGYPSGHAAAAFLAVAVTGDGWAPAARAAAWGGAGAVAAARVVAGVHLPLDAVGGAALGILAGSAARAVAHRPR